MSETLKTLKTREEKAMTKWNSSNEKCATCDYWSGPREIINFGNYDRVENNDRGACNFPGSASRHIDNKPAVFSCPNWRKWGAIK